MDAACAIEAPSQGSNVNFGLFNHPVLDLPLTEVLRPEIALSLQQMLKIYTIGSFLRAWDNPAAQAHIEHLFDNAEQALHAATLCTTWVGWGNVVLPAMQQQGWMRGD
jgi:hypothetical protein